MEGIWREHSGWEFVRTGLVGRDRFLLDVVPTMFSQTVVI